MRRMTQSITWLVLFSCICIVFSNSAAGQDSSKYPTVMNPEKFSVDWAAFYRKTDAMTAAIRKELPHHLDLPYGEHPKQKLDLYLPKKRPNSGPIFIFIHGGGFVEGDRAHYGYVARPLAAHGVLTVVCSYRLSPAHYPDQADDIRAVVAWVFNNIATYGGDPNQIYIGGHSAGAILSSFVAVKNDWLAAMSLPPNLIKGFVPVSGPYDLRPVGSFIDFYLPDPAKGAEASPLLNIEYVAPTAVVAYGSQEEDFAESSQKFVRQYREKGGEATVLVLENMDHDDTALAAGEEQSPLTQAVLGLIRKP